MKYEVIRDFKDAQDNGYAYHVGDSFPRDGHTVNSVRLNDLLSGNNFQRVPLIKEKSGKKEIPIVKPVEPDNPEVVWTTEEIDKMPFMKLKSIAKKNGVDVTDKKADEIRSDLKEKLGL